MSSPDTPTGEPLDTTRSRLARQPIPLPYGAEPPTTDATPAKPAAEHQTDPDGAATELVLELAALTGINDTVAGMLVAAFETRQKLATATLKELRAVPGVGPRLAGVICEHFASTGPSVSVLGGLQPDAAPEALTGYVTVKLDRKSSWLLDQVVHARPLRADGSRMLKQQLLSEILNAFFDANRAQLEAWGISWEPTA